MTVTRTDRWHSAPTISVTQFHRVLERANSPWAPAATIFYNVIRSLGDDPGKWLGVCKREHRFATDPDAVALKMNTNSWTNARSKRLMELNTTTVTTADLRAAGITNRNGPYIRYEAVVDSLRDGIWRIRDPQYVYHQEHGDDITIEQVLNLWTEDDAERYIEVLVDSLNEWIAEDTETPMVAQIPGFTWEGAATTHYARGRGGVAIRGGAQHYSRGTNSLAWLTRTSVPPVSATFLVKHDPTMEDRGWQLVRIEDTSWTTAFANPHTASIEYEHHPDVHTSIPDIAYTVLAQTWIDVAAYVEQQELGFIPLNRSGIRGHKEWVNNPALTCPDGVFVDRIVAEIQRLQEGTDVDFGKLKTQPDPWRDHLGGNPYGRDYWIPDVFVQDIERQGGFMPVGFVVGGAFVDGAQLVQYFERARLEMNENGVITRGLVGLEALAVRAPDKLP